MIFYERLLKTQLKGNIDEAINLKKLHNKKLSIVYYSYGSYKE